MFGPHLVLEGYKCKNTSALCSKETIERILTELPDLMDMHIIMPPQVMYYDGGDVPKDHGVSGFVIIAESHIAIHTFPSKEFFTLDIFSCKDFDQKKAHQYIQEIFEPEYCEDKLLARGREFPRCEARASDIVSIERENILSV